MTHEKVHALEQRVIISLVDELMSHHFQISVFDGEETSLSRSTDRDAIIEALGQTDEEMLIVRTVHGVKVGHINLVHGNDGFDLISDNSCALEPYIAKTTELTQALEEECFPAIKKECDDAAAALGPQLGKGGPWLS